MKRLKEVRGQNDAIVSGPAPSPQSQATPTFRFSGHQTFALRIAWIPKAVQEIVVGNDPLTNVDEGITELGLGKNMVEALRCWIEAFRIASRDPGGAWNLTPIGNLVFHSDDGLDPYFEDVTTSWLLHRLITTNTDSPFFAWECLFNRWPAMEFSASQVVEAFEQEASRSQRPIGCSVKLSVRGISSLINGVGGSPSRPVIERFGFNSFVPPRQRPAGAIFIPWLPSAATEQTKRGLLANARF